MYELYSSKVKLFCYSLSPFISRLVLSSFCFVFIFSSSLLLSFPLLSFPLIFLSFSSPLLSSSSLFFPSLNSFPFPLLSFPFLSSSLLPRLLSFPWFLSLPFPSLPFLILSSPLLSFPFPLLSSPFVFSPSLSLIPFPSLSSPLLSSPLLPFPLLFSPLLKVPLLSSSLLFSFLLPSPFLSLKFSFLSFLFLYSLPFSLLLSLLFLPLYAFLSLLASHTKSQIGSFINKYPISLPILLNKGTGTLGIPYAVMQGGYLSLGAIILIAVISNYTGKLIIECLYDKPISEDGRRGVRVRKSYALIGKIIEAQYKRINTNQISEPSKVRAHSDDQSPPLPSQDAFTYTPLHMCAGEGTNTLTQVRTHARTHVRKQT